MKLLNIGYGNIIVAERVIAILSPDSAPMKRLRDEARTSKKLLDATQGRKTRAIVVTDNDYLILSSIQPETLAQRLLLPEDKVKAYIPLDNGISDA